MDAQNSCINIMVFKGFPLPSMDQGPPLNYGLKLTNNKIRPHYANSKADYAQWARIYNFVQNVKFSLIQESFFFINLFFNLKFLLPFSLQNTVKLFAHLLLLGPLWDGSLP